MQEYDHTEEQQRAFTESVQELQKVNKKLATLTVQKEELTNQIITALEHDHEGQKTYEHDIWKIEIKTPVVYSLNKRMYESSELRIPSQFNPIKESISYTIDKRKCEQLMLDAPEDVKHLLCDLIDKKPGKASVVIKERI